MKSDVTTFRLASLTIGPAFLVGAIYWITMPTTARTIIAASPATRPQLLARDPTPSEAPLITACEQEAALLKSRLGAGCEVLVRPPYVLAGDFHRVDLERHLQETILPTARALSTCYFDRKPDRPIVILLCSNTESYRHFATQLDGRRHNSYHGYYERDARRIVLNIATGNGTLAHELTHALAHFDCPELPEWFDEGLASLHEESEFSSDGLQLRGLPNWRLQYLLSAIRSNRLRPLASLIAGGEIRQEQEAIDYAHARFFCLFLQQRGLLSHYYRKLRTSIIDDPTGLVALRDLLHADSLDDCDREFREWIASLGPSTGK